MLISTDVTAEVPLPIKTPLAVKEEGQKTRTVVVEWESLEAANAGYNSDGYQEALKKLDGSAVREFRYLEMV